MIDKTEQSMIRNFKNKTERYFHPILGLSASDMEAYVMEQTKRILNEYHCDVTVLEVVLVGSRCRGLEQSTSDIDVLIEYRGDEREDVLFDILNQEIGLMDGYDIDINPITKNKSGTTSDYLLCAEEYLEQKRHSLHNRNARAKKHVTKCY